MVEFEGFGGAGGAAGSVGAFQKGSMLEDKRIAEGEKDRGRGEWVMEDKGKMRIQRGLARSPHDGDRPKMPRSRNFGRSNYRAT